MPSATAGGGHTPGRGQADEPAPVEADRRLGLPGCAGWPRLAPPVPVVGPRRSSGGHGPTDRRTADSEVRLGWSCSPHYISERSPGRGVDANSGPPSATALESAAAGSPTKVSQTMRFGIIPPVRSGVTADPEWMTSFARHAEACGFESVVLVEHAVVVSDYQSIYPYASSGKMPLPDDCRIPDPLDLMAFLAAVTDRIGLATGVLVLPNHQAGGPGQEDRHRRRPVGRPGTDVRRGGVDGRGAPGHRSRPSEPGPPHRRDDRRHAHPVVRLGAVRAPTSRASSSPSGMPTRTPSRRNRVGCPSTSGGTARRLPDGPDASATGSSLSAWRPEDLALRMAEVRAVGRGGRARPGRHRALPVGLPAHHLGAGDRGRPGRPAPPAWSSRPR